MDMPDKDYKNEKLTLFKEIERKAFHSLIVLLPICYHVLNFSLGVVYLGVGLFLLFLYITEFFRKTEIPGFRFVSKILNKWMRKEEKEKIANYVISTTNFFVVMVIFSPVVVFYEDFFFMIELAIVVPMLGDIFAAITGKWAKRNLSRVHYLKEGSDKTYEGLLAGFLTTAILAITFILLWGTHLSFWQCLLTILILPSIVAITDYYGELPLFLPDNIVNCWLAIGSLTIIYFFIF
ncbi:MAG: phosphatidate cytidylyltransferase [Candidatus Hodarchaeales archaeon]|jgi:dolichol kinase